MLNINIQRKDILSLFCFSLVVFTWGLYSQEVIGFDSRFYLFAQEMWRNGLSVFPTTYDQPYPDYPAASTILIYLSSHGFGVLNKLTAVLPSAILAAATVMMTYQIGAIRDRSVGLCAAGFLLLTVTFLKSARAISLDMYPTFLTVCSFYLVYSADKLQKPKRIRWIFLLFFLGFMFRGPIGLIMPTGVVCVYYLLERKFSTFFIVGSLSALLLLLSSVILFTMAYHSGGHEFMQEVIRMEVVGRLDDHYFPRYFYFSTSLLNYALSFPLSCLVLGGVVFTVLTTGKLSSDHRLLVQWAGWILVIMVGMSIPGDKKVRYILPMVPALALISAYPFAQNVTGKYFLLLRSLLIKLFLFLPALLVLALLALYGYAETKGVLAGLNLMITILVLLAFQGFLFYVVRNQIGNRDRVILFTGVLGFVCVYLQIIEPIDLSINRTRDLVLAVERQRLEEHADLVFYRERQDGLPIKYLINMPKAEQPLFIDSWQSLVTYHQPAFFVASQSYFNELPASLAAQFQVVVKESLGHVPIVVFKNTR